MLGFLLIVVVSNNFVCSMPVKEPVKFRPQGFVPDDAIQEFEKGLVEYLDRYYDEYLDQNSNDVDVDEEERMQSDQPTSPEFGPLSTLFVNLSSMVNYKNHLRGENQSDIEYIRTMRNRRNSKTDDRTKDTWIQILKDNILRQVGRGNSNLTKLKDKIDLSGLNISNFFPAGQIVDDEYFSEKLRSYYPSCTIPATVDPDVWRDDTAMNLYFELDKQESTSVSIATASLRLHRILPNNSTNGESSYENSSDEHLMRVSIYWYTKSLKRQRVKRRLCDSKVIGENTKYVDLSVLPAMKAWIKGKNLGLAVVVEDQEGSILKAGSYIEGASCMVGTSTPKPIPTAIIDAARWANELEHSNGDSTRGSSSALYDNFLLFPTLDICTFEFPPNGTDDPVLLNNWHNACDFKRIQLQVQKMFEKERSAPTAGTRHIRHQKQHMHVFDPRSRIINQKVIMTNQEFKDLSAKLLNGNFTSVNR